MSLQKQHATKHYMQHGTSPSESYYYVTLSFLFRNITITEQEIREFSKNYLP